MRPQGERELGTRTELKNINSFRFVERAIDFEIERQIDVLESGGEVVQETRLYDPERNETRPMRGKEEAHDYRYFPDPDLPPMVLDDALVDAVRQTLPELPDAKRRRLTDRYGLGADDAQQLTASRETAEYFEAAVDAAGGDAQAKPVANWILGELSSFLNRDGIDIDAAPVEAAMLGGLIRRIADGTVSGKIAKDVFAAMWQGAGDADAVIDQRGLRQITDSAQIETVVDEVLAAHPEQVAQYRAGQQKVFGYLVGQVMKATRGQANPGRVNEILRARLER